MDPPRPRPHRRANSISTAVLARRKLRRRVTFTSLTDPAGPSLSRAMLLYLELGTSGTLAASSPSDCELELLRAGPHVQPLQVQPQPQPQPQPQALPVRASRLLVPLVLALLLPTARLLAPLTRVRLQPHPVWPVPAAMGDTVLLDTVLMSPGGTTALPEFNKRPLTDTPIVLGVASPVTRYALLDEEEDVVSTRKNISHLSLADLNAVAAGLVRVREGLILPTNTNTVEGAGAETDTSVAPTEKANQKAAEADEADPRSGTTVRGRALVNSPAASISSTMAHSATDTDTDTDAASLVSADPVSTVPAASAVSPSAGDISRLETFSLTPRAPSPRKPALRQIKQDLLPEVPPELQLQFQKTPLFEKLKDMLLLKPFARLLKAYTLNIAGQTSLKISPDGRIASVDVGSKLVIVMVGLPARGKSYITNKLTRYLNWLQHDCRVFNVGNTRRMDKNNVLGPASRPLPDTSTPLPHTGRSPALGSQSPAHQKKDHDPDTSHLANFFNPENKALTEIREKWAMDTLDTLLNWVIDGPGSVGILDATNSTKKRRLKVVKRIQERSNGELKVLFLESICADPAILDTNIRLKLSGPDYRNMDPELALKDFIGRLNNYESAYEPIDEEEEQIPGFQYVKMIDVGKKVVSFNIQGFLASQTIYFLLNFNLCERQIWLTRHGESVDNLSGRIGGDSPLTKRGLLFSKTLARFLNYQRREFRRKQLESFSSRLELRYNELVDKADRRLLLQDSRHMQIPTEPSFCVWTSMLMRAVETGQYFDEHEYNVKAMRMLNELGGGKYEGMTYDDIRRKHPKEFEGRIRNKLTYRYPGVGGESYLDVMVRLRPLINEIERTTDHLLIISHRVVLRVLLAYFLNLGKSAIVDLDVPLHTLYVLELKPYGTEYAMYEYDKAADWFKKVEPEHQKNVREVGVNFRERKYSVVPTAPPTAHRNSAAPSLRSSRSAKLSDKDLMLNFSVRQSLAAVAEPEHAELANLLSSRKLADLNKLRKPRVE